MEPGYVYCMTNPSMPGLVKVGMTARTPNERLSDANAADTWRPPTPYQLEFAKSVNNAKQKEIVLHRLLTQYTERVNPRREFFRTTPDVIRAFFDLMDGEYWVEPQASNAEDTSDLQSDTESVDGASSSASSAPRHRGCRDMTKCFTNGQRIRHVIGITHVWIGTYDKARNVIRMTVGGTEQTFSLNQFVGAHYRAERPDRTDRANAWHECECELPDGQWISTYNLPDTDNE